MRWLLLFHPRISFRPTCEKSISRRASPRPMPSTHDCGGLLGREAASEQRSRKLRDADREREALAAERKSRRCNELKAERDAAEAVMRNGATQWQYEDARARGSAVQKQIAREC